MPIWKRFLSLFRRQQKNNTLPVAEAPSSSSRRDPKKSIIKRIGLAFTRGGTSGREEFEGPEGFDFEEIEKAYNTEAYVRQAVDKYVDLMFKAGWDIVGKNQKAVDYIKLRLAAIADATKIPTKQLLIEIAEDLILYHNVFIVKARLKGGSYTFPPGITASPLGNQQPITGYFPLPVSTITIARDQNGTVKRYQQEVEGVSEPIQIKPEDMIHMYVDKPKGRAFGVPFIWSVLDDIKLLRQVEELVARLIYKDIFPLYQYQVGLPQEGYEATEEEIEFIREQISELTLDGGIVVPERHNITVIGSEGKALDAYNYLKYFEQRVFSGLGVSETMMGRGNTANRGTADNMTADMHDRIKAFQSIMALFITEYMFNELLREGGFDPLLRPEDAVEFRFKEIDLDNKLKIENMAIQKWLNNVITHEELRMEIGMDPVSDEGRLFFNMITAELERQKSANAANTVDNNARPENQNGKKTSPGRSESITEAANRSTVHIGFSKELEHHWELTKEDIVDLVKQYYLTRDRRYPNFEPKEIQGILSLTKNSMTQIAEKYTRFFFAQGVDQARLESKSNRNPNPSYLAGFNELQIENEKLIQALLNEDLQKLISNAIRSSTDEDAVSKVIGAFNALNYRLHFIANTQAHRAYIHGFVKAAEALGHTEAYVVIEDKDCSMCQSNADTVIQLGTTKLGSLPPFHPNCICKITLSKPLGKEG